jgi:Domain of unknown function (DUF5134)
MMTPGWILDILAAVMLGVATVSAARLAASGPPWRRGVVDADIDAAHLLMAIAMAGMLAALSTLPNGVWDVIFAVMTAWFAWSVYREPHGRGVRILADSHHAPHLVHSAAMLYMFVAISGSVAGGHGSAMSGMGAGSGSGMQTLNAPVVAFIFAILLAGYAVLDLDRLPGPAHVHGSYFAGLAVAPAGAALAGASGAGGSVSPAAAFALSMTDGGVTSVAERPAGPGQPAGAPAGATGSTVDSARQILLSPRMAAGCRIAMGVTMAFMLIIMI